MKLKLGLMLSVFLSLSACKAADQIEPSPSQAELKTYTKQQVLVAAHAAITSADASALAEISTFPLHIRNQKYDVRQDSDGAPQYYILDENQITDHLLSNFEELQASNIISNIAIEGAPDSANTVPYSPDEKLEELIGIEEIWKGLDLSHFHRGFGDAEHYIWIGTDPNTHKVRAIYMN